MDERGTITLNFPVQVKSITSDCLSQTVTTSGQYMTSTSPKNYTFTCELEEGYKISGIDFTDGTGGYNSLSGFTDNTFTISISGASGISSTVGINVSEVQKVQKSISLDNLARFKAKCDQTYAKVGEGGGITQSTVIERPESLPTATADSPDFVEVGGVLYRKKVVDGGVAGVLTSSTIKGVFKIDSPYILDARVEANLNFSSNNTNFTRFFADFTRGESVEYGSTTVYNGRWTNTAYQTVNFGNDEQTLGSTGFYDYFRQVASPVTPSVTYSYVALADA